MTHCKVCTGIIVALILFLSVAFIVLLLGGEWGGAPFVSENSRVSRSLLISSAMKFTISIPALEDGKTIPQRFTCDGDDINPQIVFDGILEGAKSIALIMDDPDAPSGDFVHWVIYNIPPSVKTIGENNGLAEGFAGVSSFGTAQYGGPCPPPGKPHRYFFKAYALDVMLRIMERATKQELLDAMKGHIIAQSETMGMYGR